MKKHIDPEKIRIRRDAEEKLPLLLDYGDEEDFVRAVKAWKKDLLPEELRRLIELFRAARAEKRGL